MVVLIRAVVGMRAPLFAVDANATLVIGLLKDVIKEKIPDKIKCSAARLHLSTAFLVVIAWLFGENPQDKEECVGSNRRGLRCTVVVIVAFLSMTITFLPSLKAHCDDMIKEAMEAGVAVPSQEVRVVESTEIATMEPPQQGRLDSLDPTRILEVCHKLTD